MEPVRSFRSVTQGLGVRERLSDNTVERTSTCRRWTVVHPAGCELTLDAEYPREVERVAEKTQDPRESTSAAADLSLGQNHCRWFWDGADVVGWRSELQPQFSPAGQPFSGPLRLPLRNEQGSNQCTCTLDSKIPESCLKSLPSKTISSYINQILQRSRTSRSLPACLSVYPSSIY